jgi:hypothetical protein
VFAAGNVLHAVDTADIAALDGTFVAGQVDAYLDGATEAPAHAVRLVAESPLRWIAPGLLRAGDPSPPRGRLLAWTDELIRFPRVTVSQGGEVIAATRLIWPASPGRVFRIPSSVLSGVDLAGADVTIGIANATHDSQPVATPPAAVTTFP